MPKFIYKSIDSDSAVKKGVIFASSSREAALKLKPNYILSLKRPISIPKFKKPSKDFWVIFFYNLSVLLNSSFNLQAALNCMVKEEKDEKSLKILSEIYTSIIKGRNLSSCLEPYSDMPYHFYIISLINQSENGGYIKETLKEVNDFLSTNQKLKSDLKSALLHPFLILTASIVFLITVNFFIFPRFESVFKQFDYALSPLTTLFITLNKLVILGLIFILFLLLFMYIFPKYNYLIRKMVSHIPFIKRIINKFNLANFFKNVSCLLSHGFTLTQALDITYTSCQSIHFKSKIKIISKAIQNGESLSKSILCMDGISNFDIQTIAISEQSAALPQNLRHLSNILENELKKSLDHYIKLIEPLAIITIGIWLGITICLLFLPVFKCIQNISYNGL